VLDTRVDLGKEQLSISVQLHVHVAIYRGEMVRTCDVFNCNNSNYELGNLR
jgi:hypothetical protein